MRDIDKLMLSLQKSAETTSATGLGIDTEALRQAKKELQDLYAEIAAQKRQSVGTLTKGDKRFDELANTKDQTGFDASKSFEQNIKTMGKTADDARTKIANYTKALADANAVAAEATKNTGRKQSKYDSLTNRVKNAETKSVVNIAKKINSMAVDTSLPVDAQVVEYQKLLAGQIASNGSFKSGGRQVTDFFAKMVGFTPEQIKASASQTALEYVKNVNNALMEQAKKHPTVNKQGQNFVQVKAAQVVKDSEDIDSVKAKQIEAATELKTAQGESAAADAAVAAAKDNLTQVTTLLKTVEAQIETLKQLREDVYGKTDKQYEGRTNAAQNKVNKEEGDAKGPIVDATGKIVKGSHDALEGGRRAVEGYNQGEQIKREAESAQRDADNFKAQLTSSIKQWMSAREVVNLIKQGIRQAYQEIQNLDKAMTNIAVVTDMSVGELWGKIDQYMSLAQQYGVTTQGVYEVSQLYYQQGLGTAEVMEATTETLKMARIAGMGYAEAADAMTVAIRSFKMEMSDAAHVTDVYSKVAAVTASDTEELAIAMSKTASSAESVGSSFENTTAMLAVMVETTRESAQNLGSALKSIISRYGEMKSGLTQDSEGEVIDYNKTDAALRSVGISLKDAQGQFRNFDDVIFELSAKWDSLDKNTQRYIATIMAGNRQQSRFIALVDNWERLDEVAGAAQDSEDAGLLQYAKTLDSLETKLNNISTSFQQFYMSIINGPAIGGALEFVNNLIKGFNKLSKFTSIFTVASIVSGVKLLGTIFVNTFSSSFNNIAATWKATLSEMTLATRQGANDNKQQFLENASTQPGEGTKAATMSRKKAGIGTALTAVSLGLSLGGSAVAAENQEAGAVMTSIGAGLSIGTQLGMINPVLGAIAGIITTVISWATSWPTEAQKAQEALDKAQQASQEADIKRAEARNRVTELKQTIDNLKRLEKARYDSEEAQQAYLDASNSAFEKFPELSHSFDEMGNAIVDASNAEELLTQARRDAAEATLQAAAREDEEIQKQITNTKARLNKDAGTIESRVQGNIASSGQMAISYADPNNEYVNKRVTAEQQSRKKIEGYFSQLATDSGKSVTKLSDLNFQHELEKDLNWGTRKDDILRDGLNGRNAAQDAYNAIIKDFGEEFVNKMLDLPANSDSQKKMEVFQEYLKQDDSSRKAFLAEQFATKYHLSEESVRLDSDRDTILNSLIESDSVKFNEEMLKLTSQGLSIPQLFQTIEEGVQEEGSIINKFFAGNLDNFYEWAATKLDLDTEAGQTYRDKKNEWYRDERTLEQLNASSDAARQATAKSWTALQFNLLDDKTFEQLGKVEGLSEFIGTSLSNEVDEKLKELALAGNLYTHDTEGNVTGYTETAREYLQKAYDGYREQFQQLLTDLADDYDINDFNEFTQKIEKGTLTRKEIQETFEHFRGKVDEEGDKLLDAWEESYLEELDDSAQRAAKAIQKNSFTKTIGQVTQIFTSENTYARLDLDAWLQKYLSDEYFENVVDFTDALQAQVEAGKITEFDAGTITTQYLKAIEYIRTLPSHLQEQALAIFMEADLTSITGKAALKTALESAGLSPDQITSVTKIEQGAVNLVTEYNNLQNMAFEGLNKAAEAIKKSTDGMNAQEAVSMMNTYEGAGLSWQDLKVFDGKVINTNLEPIWEKELGSIAVIQESLQVEAEKYEKLKDYSSKFTETSSSSMKAFETQSGLDKSVITDNLDGLNTYFSYFDETKYQDYLTETGKDISRYDYVGELLAKDQTSWQDLYTKLEAYQKAQAEKLVAQTENAIALRAQAGNGLDETATDKKLSRIQAYQDIVSKGLTGYSETEASKIGAALGFDETTLANLFQYDEATNTYTLIKDALKDVPSYVSRALGYIVSDQAKAFQERLASLGEGAATGEETLDQQAVEGLLKEYGLEGLEDWQINSIQFALKTNNKKLFAYRLTKLGKTPEEIEKAWQEYQRGLQKGTQDYTQEVLDSQAKIISGEMTAEDIAVLDNEQLRGELDKFIAKPLSKQIDDYINSIIQSYNDGITSFDSATSSIKSAYKQSLISKFGEETSIAKTLSSREAMSYDTAAQLAAELETLGIQTELAWEENATGAGLYLQNLSDIQNSLKENIKNEQYRITQIQERLASPYLSSEARSDYEQELKEARTRLDASQELSHALEWQKETLSNSFADTIETFATATEVSASELADEYKKLTGREMSLGDAQGLAKSMNEAVDPSEKIRLWTEELAKTGTDIDIATIKERLQQLGLTLIDELIGAISDGISSLGDSVGGSLSAENFGALSKRYTLSGRANLTSTGYTFNGSDQRSLIGQLYNEASKRGAAEGFGAQIWETMQDSTYGIFSSYEDIDKEIAEIGDNVEGWARNQGIANDAAKGYLAVLKQIQSLGLLDPDNPLFNFMDKEPTEGITDNFDSYLDTIDTVKTAFSSLKSGEPIGYKDFYNMMDFINDQGQWENFSKHLSDGNIKYEDFVNSVVENTGKLGKVDIKGIAVSMGISVDAAMDAMSGSMAAGLKQVAQDQIKYLSGLEAMLEAMAALESIPNIDLSLNIDINGDKKDDTLDQLYESWTQFENVRKNEQLEINVKTVLENFEAPFDSFAKMLGFKDFKGLFGGEFNIGEEADVMLADAFGTLSAKMPKDLTSGQYQTLSQYMYAALSDFMEFDEKGNIKNLKEGWQEALHNWINSFDFSDIPETYNLELQQKINAALAAGGDVEITPLGQIKLKKGKTKEDIEEQVKQEYAKNGLEVVDITVDSQGIVTVNYIQKEIKTYVVNNGWEEVKSKVEGQVASQYSKDFDFNTEITGTTKVTANLVSGEFSVNLASDSDLGGAYDPETGWDMTKLESMLEQQMGPIEGLGISNKMDANATLTFKLTTQTEELQKLSSLATDISSIKEMIAAGLKVDVTTDEATSAFDEIYKAYVDLKRKIESDPISVFGKKKSDTGINRPESDRTKKSAISKAKQAQIDDIVEEKLTIPEESTYTQEIIIDNTTALENIQSVKDALSDLANNGNTEVTVSLTGASAAITAADTVAQRMRSIPNVTRSITLLINRLTQGFWTGTMNNISGSAFADGSIGRMMSGAQLANKALVGELGPELAVYDGQYHMLGANGAEFVNLPKDAIIFNHLQTQGILNGQMNIRGTAMADGNVSGPAFAGGGAAAALAVVRRAKSVWQGLLDDLTAAELVNSGGGGGGGGGDDAAVDIDDLEEWYNLSRKISRVEQDINNLLAERENIATYDGHEYANNLMKQKKLLLEQMNYQRTLLDYQKEQLEAQKEHILSDSIWSKFLTFDENGTLQYIEGNETNGGKGALKYLQELKDMSAAEQTAAVTKLGYTYTDTDGKKYEGTELVEQFIADLQEQIDDYDELADTVNETEETLQDLQTTINEVDEEFRENRMELEQAIYDALVDAWEKEIDALEEQKELIEEANDAYVEGIQEALDKEQDLYSKNESTEDRESLQRQLALLRRSGGSASEIADLESQLNDALKDEYFTAQQEAIDNIQAANERQVELLEQQITIQEEALEYQKEHGILWQRVAEVMDGGENSIVAFLQGNADGYWDASKEQQVDALNEWLKMSGIFAEEERAKYLENEFVANTKKMTKSDIVKQYGTDLGLELSAKDAGRDFTAEYNALSQERKTTIDNLLKTTYSSAIIEGLSDEEAKKRVAKELINGLATQTAEQNTPVVTPTTSGNTGGGSGGKKIKGYSYNGTTYTSKSKAEAQKAADLKSVPMHIEKKDKDGKIIRGEWITNPEWTKIKNKAIKTVYYSEGGLVNYTGPAVVHGSKSKPEAFLNAKQTAMISEAVKFAGDGGALSGIRATLEAFNSHMQSLTNITNNSAGDITIAPGAIQISVGKLNNSYDVDDLANDVMSRMVSIASKTTNRGVSRR